MCTVLVILAHLGFIFWMPSTKISALQQDFIEAVKRLLNDPHHFKQILLTFWRVFGVNFVKAWLFRSGVSLLPLFVRLLKSGNLTIFWRLFQVLLTKSSINFGLFAASYFALFKGLEEKWILMARERIAIKENKWDSGIAGALSAVTMLLFESDESIRRILGHYSAVRAFQIIYNQSDLYKVCGDWLYSLLFMLSSGQIVYTFAKRPEVLDQAYQAFLTRVTVIHPTIIQTIRNNNWRRHIDHEAVANLTLKHRPDCMAMALKRSPTVIRCDWMHPELTCTQKIMGIWPYIFKMMFPVYGSLNALQPAIFRPGTIRASPLGYIKTVLLATLRSSSFMATFILIFQVVLCGHRNAIASGILGKYDSFYFYGLNGMLAASSIFVEKSNRRVELSLYVQ